MAYYSRYLWIVFICLVELFTVAYSHLHPLLNCRRSKYGCCPDGKTDAYGWYHKGCSALLCYDKDVLCKQMKKNGDCESLEKWGEMYELCPKTCGRCLYGRGKPASAPACFKSKYGCCYDGVTAAVSEDKRPGVGCPFCRDLYRHPCKQFGRKHWCKGKFPRVRYFLKNYCFKQCGICTNFKAMYLPKEIPGWKKRFY